MPKQPIDPQAVLAHLDASLAHDWPRFDAGVGTFEYHALRMLVARARDGNDWGIVWECVLGDYFGDPREDPHCAGVHLYACGSKGFATRLHQDPLPLSFHGKWERGSLSIEGNDVTGPAGKLRCHDAMIDALDLRPGRTTTKFTRGGAADPHFILLVRAYLATHPGSLWGDRERAVGLLELGPCNVIVESESFEHVVGQAKPPMPAAFKRFAIEPSASNTYRSLANALAHGDGSLFTPGDSNLDWRTWAVHPQGSKGKPRA